MSNDNDLQRAHQLSAQASILVRRPDADRATLDRGLSAYREAAELFDAASKSADESNRPTLKMLTNQHTRLARDVERRIAGLSSPSPSASASAKLSSPTSPTSPTLPAGPNPFASRPSETSQSSSSPSPSRPTLSPRSATSPPVGLAAGRGGVLGGAGLAVHATGARGSVPPFAMRPVLEGPAGTSAGAGVGAVRPPGQRFQPGSPLYSSSSSSEPPDESYLLPGAIPDTSDPFGRFWGMLENMMEEISFPKALTTVTAPTTIPSEPGRERRESKDSKDKKDKDKGKEKDKKGKSKKPASPSESFYVVPRDKDTSAETGEKGEAERKSSPTIKTPEELALENQSLRASLDALAVHAHSLEKANKELRQRAEERDKMLQSMVSDVRHEARKARHQDVLRSQMLAASGAPPGDAATQALRKRISELEEELRSSNKKLEDSRQQNVKLTAQLDKFKEKWDKLKAKKEAKEAARARSSPATEGS